MAEEKTGLKLVAIGGGTGLSTLLRGLKQYVPSAGCIEKRLESRIEKLSAIVTVTDDGGSSGRLRRELHVLPPGDIRNCMVALAEDESLMTKLFQYRFAGDGHLQGHSFGNLFLTAMTAIAGDFLEAIRFASEILAIKGFIYPSTVEDVRLGAELVNGRCVIGETNISNSGSQIRRLWLEPAKPKALPEALDAILEADIITIGPGSLFTSILPNLIVPDIASAISESYAQKIFICNVMTQPGETDGFDAMDHLKTALQYAPKIGIDVMLVNAMLPTPEQCRTYAEKGALSVIGSFSETDLMQLKKMNNDKPIEICYCDLLNEDVLARHKPNKLSAKIIELSKKREGFAQYEFLPQRTQRTQRT